MFRNYLAAALRNLARNRLYAGISIVALAIGMCAALLSFLVIRNQLTFDRFVPGYERIYVPISVLAPPGRGADYRIETNSGLAQRLMLRFNDIEAATRLTDERAVLQRGETKGQETIYWADPNFLDVLALRVVAGDARTALKRPDGIVLPRSLARKYFGREDAVGSTLLVGKSHPMTVTAIIEDLPAHGTQLDTGILASGLASWSQLTTLDNAPPDGTKFSVNVRTYLRLARGASVERIQNALPRVVDEMWPLKPPGLHAALELVRLDRVHVFHGLNPNVNVLFAITAGVGLIILFAACVNFVNLSTARASRRALEVAVRKAAGASRAALILQFLGESLLYVTVAACLAVAITELLLPAVNAFMNSGAVFDYWRDPSLLGWLALATLALSVIAGLYPAFVLSAFRPAVALKGAVTHSRGGNLTRQILVTLQFATLIALMVAAAVVYKQRTFATQEALRVDTDQHLLLRTPCNSAFKIELLQLPGVVGAACSGWGFLTNASFAMARAPDGREISIGVAPIDVGLLELYGLAPIAGRFFSSQRDSEFYVPSMGSRIPTRGVINETAVHFLGFASPAAALGRTVPGVYGGVEIIGVVRDFSVGSVERPIAPTIYTAAPAMAMYVDAKLAGRQIPETLAAIDRLWAKTCPRWARSSANRWCSTTGASRH